MNESALQAILQEYGKELKVPTMLRVYPDLAREARNDEWTYEEFLKQVLEAEVLERRSKCCERRIREARFPEVKTLDQLDWQALNGVSKAKVLELSRCEYIQQNRDLILAGPIGTGKTHVAIALGLEAARRQYRVAFIRASELVRELVEAKDDRVLGRLHHRYMNVKLLIVDLC